MDLEQIVTGTDGPRRCVVCVCLCVCVSGTQVFSRSQIRKNMKNSKVTGTLCLTGSVSPASLEGLNNKA